MKFENVYIPYGGYWCTPFVRWQGNFSSLHPIRFAAEITARALKDRNIAPDSFDALFVGMTIPQKHSFYGAPWLSALIGAPKLTGPVLSQACATSVRVLSSVGCELEARSDGMVLAITLDRCSNGPHLYYPNPAGPGARGESEDWVWDNFNFDPYAANSMIETAENVASEAGITREEQDEMTLLRHSQYQSALKDGAGFHRRYMVTPIEVRDASGRKLVATVTDDEGPFPTTKEGLQRLKPVLDGGTVTFGSQTFPGDGNAGIILATREKTQRVSRDNTPVIRLRSFGSARVKKGFMGEAVVPATVDALNSAGISLRDVNVIKTHNPFAVNDIYFCRELDVKPEAMNNFGSSLIFGHPQGPTGMRLVIELVEELVIRGGGYGLFSGCAAGDSAMACVLQVE